MHHMKDMEYDDEDRLDQILPIPMNKRPDYPCGLRITLTEKEMSKLGIDSGEAEIDGLVHLFAIAKVTSISHNTSSNGNECCRIELQIINLGIESEDSEEEPDEDDKPSKSGKRY